VISHIFCFRSFVFVISSLNDFVCFDFPSLCGVFLCFWFPVLVRCLFDSGWNVSFEQVQIRSLTMSLTSSTLQIRRHEYSGDFNIVILVIFVGICTLPFYVINMDVVSLFTDSSFLFLANLDLYCINVLYQFKWMNIVYFFKKKTFCHVLSLVKVNIAFLLLPIINGKPMYLPASRTASTSRIIKK